MTESDNQQQEWQDLYNELLSLLEEFGIHDYLCQKDFWIVDDNWGSYQQKVYITNPQLFTDDVFFRIQQLLFGFSSDWEILCARYVCEKTNEKGTACIKKCSIIFVDGNTA